jgi:hypothetical protein
VIRSRPDGVFNRTDLKRNYSPWTSKEEQGARRGSERTPKILSGLLFLRGLLSGFPVSGGEILDYSTTPQWQLQRFQGFEAGAETELGLLSAEFTFCSHEGSELFHLRSKTQNRERGTSGERAHENFFPAPSSSSSSFSRARASVYPHKSIHRSEPPFGCKDGKIGSDDFLESDKRWWLKAPPGFPRRQERRLSSRGARRARHRKCSEC